MKKICKLTKNFQKGYLQNGVYVVNYGKKLKGVAWAFTVFCEKERLEKPRFFNNYTELEVSALQKGVEVKSGKNRYH